MLLLLSFFKEGNFSFPCVEKYYFDDAWRSYDSFFPSPFSRSVKLRIFTHKNFAQLSRILLSVARSQLNLAGKEANKPKQGSSGQLT